MKTKQSARNRERAARIEKAMETYLDEERFSTSKDENLRDLLTDLQHWAEKYGLDFPSALRTAAMQYIEERHEGGK